MLIYVRYFLKLTEIKAVQFNRNMIKWLNSRSLVAKWMRTLLLLSLEINYLSSKPVHYRVHI